MKTLARFFIPCAIYVHPYGIATHQNEAPEYRGLGATVCPPFVSTEVPGTRSSPNGGMARKVTFADIRNSPIVEVHSLIRLETGLVKVQAACQVAYNDGYFWIWIDSWCINNVTSATIPYKSLSYYGRKLWALEFQLIVVPIGQEYGNCRAHRPESSG